MSRAHLYRVLVDAEGNAQAGVTVRVLQPGTSTVISEAMFAGSSGGTTVANPFVSSDGVVNFYLDTAQRVRLGVTVSGSPEVFYDDVDVLSSTIDVAIAASDVSLTPTGSVAATDVQSGIAELASEKYGPDNPPPAASNIESVSTANSTTSYTIPDVSTATVHYITLTANCTFTFPTYAAGKSFTITLIQDGSGSRTVIWPAAVKWAGGTAPTLTTTATKTDVVTFMAGASSTWLGFVAGQNF